VRIVARTSFVLAVVLLWLVVVAAALEAYPRYRWHRIETSNRFVLAYHGTQGWPDLGVDGGEVPLPLPPEGESQMPEEDHTVDPINQSDHFGTRFRALNEEDRRTLARLREVIIAVHDRNGDSLHVYGTPELSQRVGLEPGELEGQPLADTPLGQTGVGLVQRVAGTAEPETTGVTVARASGEVFIELAAFPMKDPSGRVAAVVCTLRNITGLTLTEAMARSQQTPGHPMWRAYYFEYQKNARISWKWHTNNAGFRDDDVVLPKPPGVFRIACVGGSTTEEGYTNATTYPNLLEAKLRERFPGHAIEVINCGVVGLDSLCERRRALDFARLEPDLVIRYNGVNDICHALFPMWEMEWERDATDWERALRRSWFVTRNWNDWLWPDDEVMAAQLDRSTLQNLGLLHEVLAARGIPLALCSFATPDINALTREERDYYEWDVRTNWQGRHVTFASYCRLLDVYNRKVKEFCEESGLLYLPVAEEFQGGGAYFGDICHMRPRGIDRKASILCRQLEGYLAQQLGIEAPG